MGTVQVKKNSPDTIMYRAYRKYVFRVLYIVFSLLPINSKKITFISDSNNRMTGNFKYVYDELQNTDKDLEYYILLKSGVSEKKTYKEMFLLAFNLATSKVIMLDDYYPMIYPLKIRRKAELIQLWHAVGAFKKFGYSRVGKPGGPLSTWKDHKNYTKAIVSSEKISEHYAEGFGIKKENVVATGVPRTDIFFNEALKNERKDYLFKKYPKLQNKKVILYTPTFRGNGQQSAYFEFDKIELDKIYESFNEECVFIVKMHPFVKDEIKIPEKYSDVIFDFTNKENVNDLLFITDVLITDYSSICFEFALLNKPMIFYCFDLEEYTEVRDFYTPFSEFAPGPIVRDCDEMIIQLDKLIHVEHFDQYEFASKYFDHFDGLSTNRVVQMIEDLLVKNN